VESGQIQRNKFQFNDDPPVHPNCMCTIDKISDEWIFGPDPCPVCQELGDMHNMMNIPVVPGI
jgi:hypothetical protein